VPSDFWFLFSFFFSFFICFSFFLPGESEEEGDEEGEGEEEDCGLSGDLLDVDVLPEIASNRHPQAHQRADDRRSVGNLPHLGLIVEPKLPQPETLFAIRADVHHAQSFTAFRTGESEGLDRAGGRHGSRLS
jgi:hypothetical protein